MLDTPFFQSAQYYNELYQQKNYKAECDYIFKLLEPHLSTVAGSLLDVGCGTGNYFPFFIERGYHIVGLDISMDMLSIAKDKFPSIEFLLGDISQIELKKKFDLITMLFHVINYQADESQLHNAIRSIASAMKTGGLFVFDFWNGDAVLLDPPRQTKKNIQLKNKEIIRTTNSTIIREKNLIHVKFKFEIYEKGVVVHEFEELHIMRYLFVEELKQILENNGLTVVETKVWLKNERLTNQNWYGVMVAKKYA